MYLLIGTDGRRKNYIPQTSSGDHKRYAQDMIIL